MKPHQQACVDKLMRLKVSALYMEMGTGKTRCIIEMAYHRLQAGKITHVVWLCPCSVKKSLEYELKKHISDASFVTICGIETLSSSDRAFLELRDLIQKEKVYFIVDESNLVKNPNAIRTQRITALSELCGYRSILNGTPVSRNEADLFAQWYILDWRILGYKSYYSFARNHLEYDIYGQVRSVLEVDYLTEKIAPYTYQVKLSECETLPERADYVSSFIFPTEQHQHMDEVGELLLEQLNEWKPETIYRFLTGIYAVSCGYRLPIKTNQLNQKYVVFEGKTRFYENLLDEMRTQKLLELIDSYDYDEKIIIYFNTTEELEEVSQILNDLYGEGAAARFDGKLSIKKRDKNLDKFRADARFLLSNKSCGAYGLNLQFARIIIFYSQDWDWATKEQACARIHRIGQERPVEIINIQAQTGIDYRIAENLSRKADLVDELKGSIEKLKDILTGKTIEEIRESDHLRLKEMSVAANKRDRYLDKQRTEYFDRKRSERQFGKGIY